MTAATGKPPRAYQPIWEAMKSRAELGIKIPLRVTIAELDDVKFRRIRKGVFKERDMDLPGRAKWQIEIRRGVEEKDKEAVFFTIEPRQSKLLKDRI